MKFLAILKDSLRETLDVKLFYVMVVLSLLVILLVGSITYTPVPMERQVKFLIDIVNTSIRYQLQSQRDTKNIGLQFGVDEFQQTNNSAEPWLGNYSFVYICKVSMTPQLGQTEKQAKAQVQLMRAELQTAMSAETLRQGLQEMFVEVNVKEIPSDDPDEIRFQITTDKGTRIRNRQEWIHEPGILFGLVPIQLPIFTLAGQIDFIGDKIIGTWGAAFTMLLSTILTASFIPGMLTKGTIDLLMAKPIHRTTLFLYKFLGGLSFMFLNTVLIMVGIWVGIGLQSGIWVQSFLFCILVFTFQFAIFYSVSALVAVLTRNAIVAILATMMAWTVLVLVGWTHWWFIEDGRANKPASTTGHWGYVSYDVFKTVLPRYKDLDWLTSRAIKRELLGPGTSPVPDTDDSKAAEMHRLREKLAMETYQRQLDKLDKDYGAFSWSSSLAVSSLFIVVILGLACWRFAAKDY